MARCYALLACLVATLLPVLGLALEPATNIKTIANAVEPKKRKAKPRPVTSKIDAATEKAAIGLVNEHLPELKKLLERLKQDSPRQYDAALRDLVKSARKLDYAKNRSEELFDIEVDLLKSQSRVKLLTAKLKVRDSEADRDSLKRAAKQLLDAELAKAQYNIHYLSDRVKKAEQQLETAKKRFETMKRGQESRLERSYSALLRDAGRQTAKAPKQKKQ